MPLLPPCSASLENGSYTDYSYSYTLITAVLIWHKRVCQMLVFIFDALHMCYINHCVVFVCVLFSIMCYFSTSRFSDIIIFINTVILVGDEITLLDDIANFAR